MKRGARVVRGAVTSHHAVHLFDTPESLGSTAAAFLRDGFQAGEILLIVARADNAERVLTRLGLLGCDVAGAKSKGRLITVDAAAALVQITVAGQPNARLFDRVIASRVRELAARGTLRIYGELVELLAERGDHDAALAVESFWEDLSAKCSFNLLCGYSSAHFAPAAAESALRRICRLHRAAHANSDDALGEWLLAGVE